VTRSIEDHGDHSHDHPHPCCWTVFRKPVPATAAPPGITPVTTLTEQDFLNTAQPSRPVLVTHLAPVYQKLMNKASYFPPSHHGFWGMSSHSVDSGFRT